MFKHRQGRQRVRRPRRPPDFLFRIARHAHVVLDLVIPGTELIIFQRPVQSLAVERMFLHVIFMVPGPHGIVVHCRAAVAVTGIEVVPDAVPALLKHMGCSPLQASGPDLRTVQISQFPISAFFEHQDAFAGLGQDGRIDTARSATADDYHIHFFGTFHVTMPEAARYAPGRECRGPQSLPWCRKPRPRRHFSESDTQAEAAGRSSRIRCRPATIQSGLRHLSG